MPLSNSYVLVYGQLPEIFEKLADGQAPTQFTQQHLKDLGFTSANHKAIIPLLKSLGFLTADGAPTNRYHEYRDKSRSRYVMAEALREAYADLFVIKAIPSESDRALIEGKFKSAHNVSERVAKLMANTFFSLLSLADLQAKAPAPPKEEKGEPHKTAPLREEHKVAPSLHYNIQIHLPATKDVEVYNAIFKSLKEHLLE